MITDQYPPGYLEVAHVQYYDADSKTFSVVNTDQELMLMFQKHRSFGAPRSPPQQFLNLDEEEEGEERRMKKRKKEKRKKKGELSPPPLIF